MPTFYVTMIFVKIKVRTDCLLFHTATCLTSISICQRYLLIILCHFNFTIIVPFKIYQCIRNSNSGLLQWYGVANYCSTPERTKWRNYRPAIYVIYPFNVFKQVRLGEISLQKMKISSGPTNLVVWIFGGRSTVPPFLGSTHVNTPSVHKQLRKTGHWGHAIRVTWLIFWLFRTWDFIDYTSKVHII